MIILKFIALRVEARGDGPAFNSSLVDSTARLRNSTKCHFKWTGKTRRRSVKGILALLFYILTFGLL